MKTNEFIDKYFDYYMHLEQRFIETRNYVTFSVDNYKTYSNEYTTLLIAICADIDGLLKEACGYPGDQHKTMSDYRIDIVKKYPKIEKACVKVSYFRIEIQPFKDISTGMDWWQSYNHVKHNRTIHSKKANLETVLYALAALFVLNRYELNRLDNTRYCLMERSVLFRMKGWEDEFRSMFTTENGKPVIIYDNEK